MVQVFKVVRRLFVCEQKVILDECALGLYSGEFRRLTSLEVGDGGRFVRADNFVVFPRPSKSQST